MTTTNADDQDGPAKGLISTELATEDLLAKYVRDSLQQPNLLQGLLGCSTAQLWELTTKLDAGIKSGLSSQPDRMAAFEALAPAVEMLLKLHRQAERYVQVAAKLTTSGPEAAEAVRGHPPGQIESTSGEDSAL
jgi:hypothetical protein